MKSLLFLFGLLALLPLSNLNGDDSLKSGPQPASSDQEDEKEWSAELGSGVLFSNVRVSSLDAYTLVPIDFTASLAVDEVSLDDFWGGIFRGNTEFIFRGFGMAVTTGTESRIVGFNVGPRYNFVQKGWPVVPFIGADVGFGFADSRGKTNGTQQVGLGQDMNFYFGVVTGIRYYINEDWFVRFTVAYNHFSNAGLSEPARQNRAIDAMGPELSVGSRF